MADVATLEPEKVLHRPGIRPESPAVLVVLAAGMGTRFGSDPKCVQLVNGVPLARRSIENFPSGGPAICIVGYKHQEVMAAIGADHIHILSVNPAGGTALAAFEAFSEPSLLERNPLVVLTMGDRVVPRATYEALLARHREGNHEADLTFLTAIYEPPRNSGRGRILRDAQGLAIRIVEERDLEDAALLALTEGNCPLYALRARTLYRHLANLDNSNAQRQFYLTDIVRRIAEEGGEIRTITTVPGDREYDLLCADVTRPADLPALEETLAIYDAAREIELDRPAAQTAAIARQLSELMKLTSDFGFDPAGPVGIGVCGGRLRIAFMHPDMARFQGPAWQMPIGAGSPEGNEQVVMVLQESKDNRMHLLPANPAFREAVQSLPCDVDELYPGPDIVNMFTYEAFGTRMAERRLRELGYSEESLAKNMRRPFVLVENALASMRTIQNLRVQGALGRESFRGLRIATTGDIPQGGFSSSSAVTLATENAVNALWGLGISSDDLVHLACQAEYGTGVRAGSLDQATEQKGRPGEGTLISSNPRENYRVIRRYAMPTGRIRILFPYTVDRDREAWRWSFGMYGEDTASERLTTGEIRKMTGKAAEIAALLTDLPEGEDFFGWMEEDLVARGAVSEATHRRIADLLARLPLMATKAELLAACPRVEPLFAGWREPREGVPLRAMVAYLFGEVAKNFYLIHHPDRWIEFVRLSQLGDRAMEIDWRRLPTRKTLESEVDWEREIAPGTDRLDLWLGRLQAIPHDYNRDLKDGPLPPLHLLRGGSFFRGLALIDLAEAMLRRAFPDDATAVRVNAAGQGDFFQVHVDLRLADPDDVKSFLERAFHRRFGLAPRFVDVHPGGGAAGVRLPRFDLLPKLVERLSRV